MFSLRAGRPADIESMHRLDLLCFAEPFRFSLRTMRKLALHPRAFTVVAEVECQLIGFVVIELMSDQNRQAKAYVVTLDVDPSHRRSGIAAALMQNAERTALSRNAGTMALHVWVDNTTALRFYERAGFVQSARAFDFYRAGLDAFVYRKALNLESDEDAQARRFA